MVNAVVLDVNETLFSLDAVGAAFEDVGLGADQLPLWFARLLRDGFAEAATGRLVTFPELARHHVHVLAHEAAVPIDDARVDRVVGAFDAVSAHPDVEAGLRRLAGAGIRLVAFTNGSAAVVQRFLARAGLEDVVEAALDVTAAGRWKPDAAAYAWVCGHLGLAPSDVAMLAVHPWDVSGAMAAEMVGAWVDRDGARWPGWLPAPTITGASLEDVAEALLARRR